jgi:zinc transporter ZupT
LVGTFAGAWVPGVQRLWARHREAFLSMGAGLLIGTALLHLLPHAAPLGDMLGYSVLAGFLGVLMLEALIDRAMPEPDPQPAHGGPVPHHHEHLHLDHDGVDAHEHHLAISAVVGFSLHGVVDGVALYAAAKAGSASTTALALLAHHVPLSASYASLLRLGGRQRSFWPLVIVSAIMPLLGVLLAQSALGQGALPRHLCGVAAGVFLYLASHNLLPVMDLRAGGRYRLLILLGGAAIAAVTQLVGG